MVLSQFSKNKIGISRFRENEENVFLVTYRYLGHFGHRVDALPPVWSKRTKQRMKMMAGQRSPKTRPTTLSQQGSTVLSRSRNIKYYVTVVKNFKGITKITVHGELNIYFWFHGK